jgi:hypothetical protein
MSNRVKKANAGRDGIRTGVLRLDVIVNRMSSTVYRHAIPWGEGTQRKLVFDISLRKIVSSRAGSPQKKIMFFRLDPVSAKEEEDSDDPGGEQP